MRLFIAIEFDEEILQALTKLQSDWKVLGVCGNFTPVQNLHLTLAFIGEYGNPNFISEVMNSVPFKSFSINLDGIGTFRDIFWAGIAANDELSNYVRRLRRALAENNIPYDRKKFSPHITLVRRAEFNRSIEELLKNPPNGEMEVKSVSLMSSTRGKSGMIYTKVGGVEVN
ncbi:MAG: RNA 2',3'-cyclic phosphodiesterase [Selenomonadaceae bacterium]|nr:RNA 2',3'-cyclic phosphodiesterase [Selenomonadaceae bacterium]